VRGRGTVRHETATRFTSSTRRTRLRTAAFNALLKTLEEPPAHIVFMMATTQPEDIPQDHPLTLPALQLFTR